MTECFKKVNRSQHFPFSYTYQIELQSYRNDIGPTSPSTRHFRQLPVRPSLSGIAGHPLNLSVNIPTKNPGQALRYHSLGMMMIIVIYYDITAGPLEKLCAGRRGEEGGRVLWLFITAGPI